MQLSFACVACIVSIQWIVVGNKHRPFPFWHLLAVVILCTPQPASSRASYRNQDIWVLGIVSLMFILNKMRLSSDRAIGRVAAKFMNNFVNNWSTGIPAYNGLPSMST